jgi:hypothetical protein
MPAKPPTGEDQNELVPLNFRAPRWLAEELDRWVEQMNQHRRWPKMTRPNLMRGVLQWAIETRPDWESSVGRRDIDPEREMPRADEKRQEPPPERVVELDEPPPPPKRSAEPGAGSAPPKKKSR